MVWFVLVPFVVVVQQPHEDLQPCVTVKPWLLLDLMTPCPYNLLLLQVALMMLQRCWFIQVKWKHNMFHVPCFFCCVIQIKINPLIINVVTIFIWLWYPTIFDVPRIILAGIVLHHLPPFKSEQKKPKQGSSSTCFDFFFYMFSFSFWFSTFWNFSLSWYVWKKGDKSPILPKKIPSKNKFSPLSHVIRVILFLQFYLLMDFIVVIPLVTFWVNGLVTWQTWQSPYFSDFPPLFSPTLYIKQ